MLLYSCASKEGAVSRTLASERDSVSGDNVAADPDLKSGNAAAPAWKVGSVSTELAVIATWQPVKSKHAVSQWIAIFKGDTCDGSPGLSQKLASILVDSFTSEFSDESTQSFRIETLWDSGVRSSSSCSQPVHISRPKKVGTSVAWKQNSPYPKADITALWKKSSEPWFIGQTIEVFPDARCQSAPIATMNVGSAAETFDFTGEIGKTYSFRVVSHFEEGVSLASPCSAPIELVPLKEPANIAASIDSAFEVTTSWSFPFDSRVTGYVVAWDSAGGDAPAFCSDLSASTTTSKRVEASINNPRVVLRQLAPITNYSIRICSASLLPDGSKAYSGGRLVSAKTLQPPPEEMRNLALFQVVPGTDQIRATWEAPLIRYTTPKYLISVNLNSSTPPSNCRSGAFNYELIDQTQYDFLNIGLDQSIALRFCSVNSNPTPQTSRGIASVFYVHTVGAQDVVNIRAANISQTSADIVFSNSDPNAKGFVLEFSTSPTKPNCPSSSTFSTSTVFSRGFLEPNINYYARVCSLNGDKTPLASAGVEVQFKTLAFPDAFQISGPLVITLNDGKPDFVTWFRSGFATNGYIVELAVDSTCRVTYYSTTAGPSQTSLQLPLLNLPVGTVAICILARKGSTFLPPTNNGTSAVVRDDR